MKYGLCAILLSLSIFATSQNRVDVTAYRFDISLNDNNDSIHGVATISFLAKEATDTLSFDLASAKQKGMTVDQLSLTPRGLTGSEWIHENGKISIRKHFKKGDRGTVVISYRGIPSDGLIISKNKFGRRTFFSDNWPNRAHQWIPCVDNPADKATVEFVVTAPAHYGVVSNGLLAGSQLLEDGNRQTHWKEETPLPTKVMVIGVADFAVDTAGIVDDIPVTSWVFPENKAAGFSDYSPAKDILAWFIRYIGPYPYKKLANVQSKTIFGGMENAGAIFYYENSVTGKNNEESLLAHEIAHQWFGDMATEKSFTHLWLSEGFATYLSHLYLESKYGHERLVNEMIEDRLQAIDFGKRSAQAVVDSTTPYMQLLNANSYQKGGWVLHMLRCQLGDSIFHRLIREYYREYAGRNADSRDFQKVCEKVSGKNLETFFRQWIYTPGCPKLKVNWKYDAGANRVHLVMRQIQKTPFILPLTIRIKNAQGFEDHTVILSDAVSELDVEVAGPPTGLSLDPQTCLLFEGEVTAL